MVGANERKFQNVLLKVQWHLTVAVVGKDTKYIIHTGHTKTCIDVTFFDRTSMLNGHKHVNYNILHYIKAIFFFSLETMEKGTSRNDLPPPSLNHLLV